MVESWWDLRRFRKPWMFDLARKICPGFRVGYLYVYPGDHWLVNLLYGPRIQVFRTHNPSRPRWGGVLIGLEFGQR